MSSGIGLSRLRLVAKTSGIDVGGDQVATSIANKLKAEFGDGFEDPKARVTTEQLATVRNKYFAAGESTEAKGAQRLLDVMLAALRPNQSETAAGSQSGGTKPAAPARNDGPGTLGCMEPGGEDALPSLRGMLARSAVEAVNSAAAGMAGVHWSPREVAVEADPDAVLLDWEGKRMQVLEHPACATRALTSATRHLREYDLESGAPLAGSRELDPARFVHQVSNCESFSLLGPDLRFRQYRGGKEIDSLALDTLGVKELIGDGFEACFPNEFNGGVVLAYSERIEMRNHQGDYIRPPIATGYYPAIGFSKGKGVMAVADTSPEVRFFDAKDGTEFADVVETKHTDRINRVEITPKGDLVITHARNGALRVNDIVTGEETLTLSATDRPRAGNWRIAPGGELMILREDGSIELRNPRTGELIGEPLPAPSEGGNFLGGGLWISPDAKCIAAHCVGSKKVHVWSRDSDGSSSSRPVLEADPPNGASGAALSLLETFRQQVQLASLPAEVGKDESPSAHAGGATESLAEAVDVLTQARTLLAKLRQRQPARPVGKSAEAAPMAVGSVPMSLLEIATGKTADAVLVDWAQNILHVVSAPDCLDEELCTTPRDLCSYDLSTGECLGKAALEPTMDVKTRDGASIQLTGPDLRLRKIVGGEQDSEPASIDLTKFGVTRLHSPSATGSQDDAGLSISFPTRASPEPYSSIPIASSCATMTAA